MARAIFHGQRGELRQRFREGQEDQLGALGLVVKPEDVERLSPLLLDHVNVLGRHEFVLKESVRRGRLRPLRNPNELDDLAA